MTSRGGLSIGGVGLGRVIPTHSLEEFGAVAGADITTPMTSALAAMKAGDTLYVPSRHSPVDGSVLTWKLGASTGGLTFPDGVRLMGAGRKASIVECNYSGNVRVKMFAPAGHAEFHDLGFKMGASVPRDAVPQVIFGKATCPKIHVERVDFLGGFGMCVDTWQDVTTDVSLIDVLIDGQNAGLASGANRQVAMGIAHNGAGIFRMDRVDFKGLGSNAVDRPYASHCVYVAPNTTMLVSQCRFSDHLQGRMFQIYNGAQVTPPAPIAPDVIRDCIFGAYNAAQGPYTMCETSEVKPTSYVDCYWQAQVCSSGSTVNVKGPDGVFTGCRFDGTSTDPADYLGNPDGFAGSAYDATGSWFNGVRA